MFARFAFSFSLSKKLTKTTPWPAQQLTTAYLAFWRRTNHWPKVDAIKTHRQKYTQQTFPYCNINSSMTGTIWVWFGLSSQQNVCGADVIWVAYPGSFPPQHSQLGCNRSGSLCCPNQPFGGDGAFCSK